jgi:hypothetical protein
MSVYRYQTNLLSDINQTLDILDNIKILSNRLLNTDFEDLDDLEESKITLRKILDLCEEVNRFLQSSQSNSEAIRNSLGIQLFLTRERTSKLGSENFSFNVSEFEEGRFLTLIQSVLQAQHEFQTFTKVSETRGLSEAKGVLGETLCHLVLAKFLPIAYFLDSQVGTSQETTTEDEAYQSAHRFLSQNPDYEFVIASRPFGGGQPYSLDVVNMIIHRRDVGNWLTQKHSTATYIAFECKTDSSRLSEDQKQFSYVKKQALRMFRNRSNIQDRSELGQDLLKALDENRVLYLASHIELESGKMTTKLIE